MPVLPRRSTPRFSTTCSLVRHLLPGLNAGTVSSQKDHGESLSSERMTPRVRHVAIETRSSNTLVTPERIVLKAKMAPNLACAGVNDRPTESQCVLGDDHAPTLADEDLVRPGESDVMNVAITIARLQNPVDDASRIGR